MTTSTRSGRGSGSSSGDAAAGGVYGLGFIGSLVYFIQSADSFGDGLWGVVQALVWPAFLVYDLFDMLGT